MNTNEQDENTDSNLSDLGVSETEQTEIKGGPKRIFIGSLSIAQTALPDLEPQSDVVGGVLAIGGVRKYIANAKTAEAS
jgi:hypothetical protein